jgi:6-phosphofructokinase 1
MLPKDFIREDGYHITDKFRAYCAPLIQGEDYPPYDGGMPRYARLKRALLPKKLPAFAKPKEK